MHAEMSVLEEDSYSEVGKEAHESVPVQKLFHVVGDVKGHFAQLSLCLGLLGLV